MGDRLKGKIAIVTGAGSGIGWGEAITLALEGAQVVVNDIGADLNGMGGSQTPADRVVDEISKIGGKAIANYDSVTTWEGGEKIIKAAIDTFGKLDILVNNAGILRDHLIYDMTGEEWDTVIKVHLYGHFYTTRHACTIFKQQMSGRIINTSSTSGFGNRWRSNYAAAKEGIVGFTRTIALEMGRYGVTCNAIRPAAGTRMNLTEAMIQAAAKAGRTDYVRTMESLRPDDIAPLIVWLASDSSANVNGRTFYVQTGRIALYSEPVQEKMVLKNGGFTVDELFEIMPTTLAQGLVNPAPPQ